MRTSRIVGDAEGNPDLALALRVKTCCSHGAGGGGKKPSSCEHRISQFSLCRWPRAPAFFGELKNMTNEDSIWGVPCPSDLKRNQNVFIIGRLNNSQERHSR
jgi:hypothetical protein